MHNLCRVAWSVEILKMQAFLFFVDPSQKGSQAFLTETVETGDKNRDYFHCMQMSLVVSISPNEALDFRVIMHVY